MKWYKVSLVGWLFSLAHLAISAVMVYGFIEVADDNPAIHLYNAAFFIQVFLLVLFLYARFKKERLFKAE